MIHHYRQDGLQGLALYVDFVKAFDAIECLLLELSCKVLKNHEFVERFINVLLLLLLLLVLLLLL